MIVPVQAGSGADAILRIVANKMSDNMKQQIVLDNQPGAAGLIAMERAARAPTDGYTIAGVNDGSLVMTPHLYKKVNYDPLNSFEPVSLIAQINWVLIANPHLPTKNVREFIALAKARPRANRLRIGRKRQPAAYSDGSFRRTHEYQAQPRALSRRHAGGP